MKKRVLIVSISIFSLFALLIVQYFRLQVLEGDYWSGLALSQHEFIVKEPAARGSFYSNTSLKKGNPEKPVSFCLDVAKFHLFIDPSSIPKEARPEIICKLVSLLGQGEATTPKMAKIAMLKEFSKKSRNRKIAMWIDREKKEEILKWWHPFARSKKIASNALYFVTDYKRSYPGGKQLGQVLHTIRDLKDETTQEGVPTGGLEAYFNTFLKGKQGKKILLRSPLNPQEIDKVIEKPENGADIYLTINHCIQAIAEEEIEKGVKRSGAKAGWAIMMDPHTGEILALAQYPFFDPSNYKEYFNDPQKIELSKVRGLTDAYELGSIMKPITIAIALKANEELKKQNKPPIFTVDEKIDTSRSSFPGRGRKPLKDTHFYHYCNLNLAIQKSSNVYMAELIDRAIHKLGNPWYRQVLTKTFGFGEKTGIELPGEATGLVPTPGKLHPNGALEWSVPTPYSLAMGHNISATGFQMLRAWATFANGGYLVEPTLVRKIVKKNECGEEVVLLDHTDESRLKRRKKVLSKACCQTVLKALKFTTKPGGTASQADISGYSEGGKTGSAEKIIDGVYSKKRHVSSFIGLAPIDLKNDRSSRFILLVTIDDPEYRVLETGARAHLGGGCAAPIFKNIGKRTLEYLGVAPDDPHGYPLNDPRYDPEKADWVKEIKALKSLSDAWNKK